jgi:copper chaperone NosL
MKKHHPIFLIFLLFLASCTVEPQPINYGYDACHYCKMNIVDRQHAAEFVTSKGKVYKFDAIECMLNQTNEFDRSSIELYLITDYNNPGSLTDAATCTYLISQKIPSPMGAFLTGFGSSEKAQQVQQEAGGNLYSWQELKTKFDK